ncbi:MAG: hypothetical protein NTU83_03245 [Candidatus Hydrogenedentes bacterium]|nr:hypothetical protein [Candidatus Hydrogenedentota bacterium]
MLWAGIAMLMAAAADPAAAVNVYVTLDPPTVPFYQQTRYTIVVEAPKDIDPKLPDMLDKFDGLAVADIHRETTLLKGGVRRISELLVRAPTKEEVDKLEADAAPVDMAEPVGIKSNWLRGWRLWALAGGVMVLGASGAGYLYYRSTRKAVATPPPAPWEVAYRRLRELDQRQWPKDEKYEPYYVDLSSILRYYIEDRFSVHAPEQTTQEFLAASSVAGLFNERQQQLLSGFLRHCDRVKFAQYVPTLAEMEHCFSVVLQFVDETVPRLESVEAQPQEAAA